MALVNYATIPFFEMYGGINTVSSSILLKSTECRDSQDVDYFPIGGFTKRNGYDALNDSPVVALAGGTGLYMARYSTAGGTNMAYYVAGDKIYRMSAALGGTWTDITSALTITDNDNLPWSFAILNDICVLGNGTDTPLQINSSGSASALSAGLPFTSFLFPVETRGYMWYFAPTVGGSVVYDRGYFSSINDPATVGSNNFVDIAKGQGGDIRGAVDYKTFLYVFKRHGIYQINYQPTRVNSSGTLFPWNEFPNPVVPGVGTQSHRSIVKFTTPSTHPTPGQELVFFVDQFGVPRIFDGVTTISFSSKIGYSRDATILSLSDMDSSRTKYAWSVNYPSKNKILCFLSDAGTEQDTCWVLDYSVGFAIGRYNFAKGFNTGALFEKADGTFKPYVADYDGKVYELDSGTSDDGQPINDYYATGDASIKNPFLSNKWYSIDIRGQNGSSSQNTRISFFLDGEDTATETETISLANSQTQWGAFIWGQAQWAKKGIINKTVEINQVAKTLRVKIESDNKLDDTMTIEGFGISGEVLGTAQS